MGTLFPKGKGQFWGVVRAIQKHWQSSLRQGTHRTQAMQNIDREGMMGLHSAGEV